MAELEPEIEAIARATAGAPSVFARITEQVTCPVCHDVFDGARALPCGHVYCRGCLEDVWTFAKRKLGSQGEADPRCRDALDCPECRSPAHVPPSGVGGFLSAFRVNSLIEIREGLVAEARDRELASPASCAECTAPAVGYCSECHVFVCEKCSTEHANAPRSSGHHLLPLLGRERGASGDEVAVPCPAHPAQLLTSYCEQCSKTLCGACLTDHQRSHTPRPLSEAVFQARDTINKCLDPTRERLGRIDGSILNLENRMSFAVQHEADLQTLVDTEFAGLQELLEQRKAALKAELSSFSREKRDALSEQKGRLETTQRQFSAYVKVVEQCLRQGNSIRVMAVRNAVRRRPSEATPLSPAGHVPLSPTGHAPLPPLGADNVALVLDVAPATDVVCALGQVVSSGVWAAACVAEGEGLSRATVHSRASFAVTLLASDGTACTERRTHVSVELTAKSTGSVVRGRVDGQHDNVVQVSYEPRHHGDCELSVTVSGKPVTGSPFAVFVRPLLRFRGNLVLTISEGLVRPWGLAFKKNGDLVVIDNNGYKAIHIFAPDGTKVMEPSCDAGRFYQILGPPEQSCQDPKGVAVDSDDNIFVIDSGNSRVLWFDATGQYRAGIGEYGSQPLQFSRPVGVAFQESSGELYICDRGNNRVQVVKPDTQTLSCSSVSDHWANALRFFKKPWDIAFDCHGNAYVVDCDNFCVRVITQDGVLLRSIGREGTGRGEFQHVSGVCVDRDGFVYATDWKRDLVIVFNPLGEFVMDFGFRRSGMQHLYKPKGIAVDDRGRVYVSCGDNSYADGCVKVFE